MPSVRRRAGICTASIALAATVWQKHWWQVASSAGRFRGVTKTFERFDVTSGTGDDGTGQDIVYVLGTLQGQALDGSPFEGVRFIDRFVLEDGLIVSQMVWNDLAESDVLSR